MPLAKIKAEHSRADIFSSDKLRIGNGAAKPESGLGIIPAQVKQTGWTRTPALEHPRLIFSTIKQQPLIIIGFGLRSREHVAVAAALVRGMCRVTERYIGSYTSLADYVQDMTEDSMTISQSLQYYIDCQAMARDAGQPNLAMAQPAADLLRTPIFAQPFLNKGQQRPTHLAYPPVALCLPILGQRLRIMIIIARLLRIALQLAADRRAVHANIAGNLGLRYPAFQQRRNLTAIFITQVTMAWHRRPPMGESPLKTYPRHTLNPAMLRFIIERAVIVTHTKPTQAKIAKNYPLFSMD